VVFKNVKLFIKCLHEEKKNIEKEEKWKERQAEREENGKNEGRKKIK
jgi:hypothetical protein